MEVRLVATNQGSGLFGHGARAAVGTRRGSCERSTNDGRFPTDIVHRFVEDRPRHYAERPRSFGSKAFGERAGVRLSGDA
jgi:hypothetical protein